MAILLAICASDWAGEAQNPLAAPAPAPFAGSFAGDKLSVVMTSSGDGAYTGEIKLGGKSYPATAHAAGNSIAGTFQSGGKDFPFTASLDNDTLTLLSGGTRYEMKRAGGAAQPQNPLDAGPSPAAGAPAPGNSAGPPLAAGDLPAGFSDLGVTDSGRSIFVTFADVKTVDALIQRVGDALSKVFDAKPKFDRAYVDSRTRGRGVASFTAALKGKEVKGIVVFGVDPQSQSSATIVYYRPDAPQADMDTLMATLPARPKMQTMQFPDKSGSIDLPAGWTTKMQSLTAGAWFITGPKFQVIIWNSKIVVDTPQSYRVKVAHQAYDSSVRVWELGGRRGPAPASLEQRLANLTISPYLNPEDAFKTILPKLADKARQAGQPWVEYGKVTATQKADPNPLIKGAEAAVFAFPVLLHIGEKTGKPSRQIMRVDTFPNGDTWAMVTDSYIAPEATFDRDLPTMADIIASVKLDDGAVQRQLDKDNQAFQAMSAKFAADHEALMQRGRDFQENQEERFRRNQQLVQAQAKARHDANSDMQEMALGLRDVYDTATGQTHRVDLYNVNGIVDSWNAAANDPNQFVQVPLRYER